MPDAEVPQSNLFHFQEGNQNFEDLGHDNGFRYWFAYDLAKCLGYVDLNGFKKGPLGRAMSACISLGIPVEENFIAEKRSVDGREISDVRLSRFGCYLSAMNSDPKKPAVAAAQAWFAVMADSFRQYIEDANQFERLGIRDDITGQEKTLGAVAKVAGVENYAYFQNAGYVGLYNMSLGQLKECKGLKDKSRSLLDFMGKQELAANLFRLSETEAKISKENIRGQGRCEITAREVGRTVRNTMIKISGSTPESLPLECDIKDTRKNIKQAAKGFKQLELAKPKSLPH